MNGIARRDFLALAGGCAVFSAASVRAAVPDGKAVLLGATAKACGMALAHPGAALILERGIHPAPEFTLSLDPETAGTPRSETGKAFAAELERNGVLKDGVLYHQPMSYFLSDFLVKRGVRVLYAAEYVRHEENGRGATVVACGNDGSVTFEAKRVVDTRPGKAIAVSGVLVARGKSVETRLFRVPLPPDANWTQARLALADAWAARKGDHPGFDLVAEAGALKRDTGFPDFFSAFEEGLAWTGT